MTIAGVACMIGLLRWFSLYTIISAELNMVVGICRGSALTGGACLMIGLIQKKKMQLISFLIFVFQVLAASQLGFMTAV